MQMLDKQCEFRYIPHHYLNIDDTPIHYVGELNHKFIETIVEGDVSKKKFIVWYVFGEEVVGFCTVGYQNLHLYLWEAMKLLIMPTAVQLRRQYVNHKQVVANVLKCRPEINAKRKEVMKIPSIMRSEFTRERERMDDFRAKLKDNMEKENEKQRDRFLEIKAKYDQEGIQVIDSPNEIGKTPEQNNQETQRIR